MSAPAPPANAVDEPVSLAPASADERLFDLEFAPYRPLRPLAGKARAEGLLRAALAADERLAAWELPLRALQSGVGRGRTIWGAISRDGVTAYELRLANPDRELLLAAVRRELAPWLALAPEVDDDGDYDALQFELAPRVDAVLLHRRGDEPGERRLWRAGGGPRVPAGRVLVVEAKRQIGAALARIKAGGAVDFAADRRLLGRVLIPELFACRRLHVVEGTGDPALVYSGISVDQLAWFLDRFAHAPAVRRLVAGARGRFDHLLFDVAVAYRQHGEAIVHPETAFYGTL